MTVWVGNYTAYSFVIRHKSTCDPIDVTGWEFQADIKSKREDEIPLLSLSTDNGGFEVINGEEGRFEMRISAAQSEDLPLGKLLFDVRRVSIVPGPVWLFGGSFLVKTPITTSTP